MVIFAFYEYLTGPGCACFEMAWRESDEIKLSIFVRKACVPGFLEGGIGITREIVLGFMSKDIIWRKNTGSAFDTDKVLAFF